MGDSILNFNDLGTDSYTGLSDTGFGYSGSSTFQDVQLGSPLVLDTSLGSSATATTDFMGVQPITSDVPNQIQLSTATQNQILSGNSDPGFSPAYVGDTFNVGSLPPQNPQASPTTAAGPMSASSSAGLTALSKFGASFATLFAGPTVTRAAVPPTGTTVAGAALPAPSTTTTLILVVVVGALILLLIRGE